MQDNEIYQKAHDLPFRVSMCVCLATEDVGALTDNCRELLSDYRDDVLNAIPDVHSDFHDESQGELDEEFIDWMHSKDRFGYLLMVETPVFKYDFDEDGSSSSASHSWCCYTSLVVYAETMDAALEQAAKDVERYQQLRFDRARQESLSA